MALISFVLSKTACKKNERLLKIAKRAVGEYTLMALLVSGYLTAVASALEILYGIKKMDDFTGVASVALFAVLLVLLIFYFAFVIVKPEPEYFGEFVGSFKNDRLSRRYYALFVVERLIVGACLILLLQTKLGSAVPLAVFAMFGVFLLIRPVYKENWQKVRAFCNFAVCVCIEAIYLSYSLVDPK